MAAEVPGYIALRTANNLHSSAVDLGAVRFLSERDNFVGFYGLEFTRLMLL
jgi:hypothetical protein